MFCCDGKRNDEKVSDVEVSYMLPDFFYEESGS